MLSRAKGGSQGVKNGQINPNSWVAERSRSQIVGKGLVLPRLLWGAGAVTLGGAAASLCLRSPRGIFPRQPWTSSTRSTCCTGPSPSSAPRAAAPSCLQGPGEECCGLLREQGAVWRRKPGKRMGRVQVGSRCHVLPLWCRSWSHHLRVSLPCPVFGSWVVFFKFLNFKGNEGSVFTGRDWSCCQSLRESWNGLVWRGP